MIRPRHPDTLTNPLLTRNSAALLDEGLEGLHVGFL